MPRLPDEILQCAVYLYSSEEAAREGRLLGGSGFLVGVPSSAKEPLTFKAPEWGSLEVEPAYDAKPSTRGYLMYAVTCRHVVEGFRDGKREVDPCPIIRVNSKRAGTTVIRRRETDWHFHATSDLAVSLVEVSPSVHEALAIPADFCLSENDVHDWEIGIGDDVHMVGRFIRHDGKVTNRPSVRFGNISVMHAQPIQVRGIRHPQDAFLVETRTIPGYSGSPVFLQVSPWELLTAPEGSPRRSLGERNQLLFRLLGVAGGWIYGDPQRISFKDRLHTTVEFDSGMMWCIPAWKLLELLNQDGPRRERDTRRLALDQQPRPEPSD